MRSSKTSGELVSIKLEVDEDAGSVAQEDERTGFLPIVTNWFDRLFISVVVFVALHLLWMRFLEAELSIYFATAISIVLGWLIVTRG